MGAARLDPRTRMLLEAPIPATLLRLGAPSVLVMLVQAAVGLVETYFVGKLGTDALAGVTLVFPVLMLMQMMSAGAMGGAISSSIARGLGAGRREDADARALHAVAIGGEGGLVRSAPMAAPGRGPGADPLAPQPRRSVGFRSSSRSWARTAMLPFTSGWAGTM